MKSSMNNFILTRQKLLDSIRPLKKSFSGIKRRRASLVLSVVLLAFMTTGAFAQTNSPLEIGAKAGVNLFQMGGRSFDGRFAPSFSGGLYGARKIKGNWGWQAEVLLNEEVTKTS